MDIDNATKCITILYSIFSIQYNIIDRSIILKTYIKQFHFTSLA